MICATCSNESGIPRWRQDEQTAFKPALVGYYCDHCWRKAHPREEVQRFAGERPTPTGYDPARHRAPDALDRYERCRAQHQELKTQVESLTVQEQRLTEELRRVEAEADSCARGLVR